METAMIILMILGVISGLSHGSGVLPDSLHATSGGKVIFTTTVTPAQKPFLVVTWSIANSHGAVNNIITSSIENITAPEYESRITLFRTTGSLELRDLRLGDSGEYSVMIISDGTAMKKGICKLEIYATISNVVLTPSSTDLVEFTSVSLSCSSSGSSINFRWLNGSSEVTANKSVQITNGGSNLTIINVTRYDQGPFRCYVFNLFSNGTSNPVVFSINYGPDDIHLKASPSQEDFDEGSDIILKCSAVSKPPAFFQWFLNGVLLSDTGPEFRLENIQKNQSGAYSCRAYNNKTMRYLTSQPAVIKVQVPVSGVVVTPSNADLMEFSSVNLSCSSSGSSLSFHWLNGTSEVTASDRVQLTNGGSTLTITNVTRYDQGPFRCNASNAGYIPPV
ncbi:cell adhesion molecule CEACAM1-like [Genypterus blacodes]|uniref:cell adhesion molecule CEACAM1-like n=1 Tax=Genypterus blacodes TaxID=154954 RepID=UPI003F770FAF